MTLRIEDYALIGDTQTAALVGKNGSIDWLCLPRFDSGACFAALLGGPEQGRWLIAPVGEVKQTRRRYREDTLVLETELRTDTGTVRLVDCMPPREVSPDVVRLVEGVEGEVTMRFELILRFDYGSSVPWVRARANGLHAVAGPNAVRLESSVPVRGENFTTVAEFKVSAGERFPFRLIWHRSHDPEPSCADAEEAVADTERWWRQWASRCTYQGPWREAVVRSLLTLKALTYAPTGGMVAAPTTSLPEKLGGVRNWDYRYCWLRDATLTLYSLTLAGYKEEAGAWRDWLLRSVAGDPSQLQIMYGVAGERMLPEIELPWLPGYAGSKPVRIGNGAVGQLQLDVYGEVLDALHQARRVGLAPNPEAWRLEKQLLKVVDESWKQKDAGIWEVRGPTRHFTHSKVMAWVAMDRAVLSVEQSGLEGPVEKWRATRAAIHAEICDQGFDSKRNSFTQSYGSKELDASLLLMATVGFLPPSDPRIVGTVAAIQRELMREGFVCRYPTTEDGDIDGLPKGEGAFLACTFWLADNLAMMGRKDEAKELFERLLELRNDVGLLAEEYDPRGKRQLGNFPQAFSHVGLVNTAFNLGGAQQPARHRQTKR